MNLNKINEDEEEEDEGDQVSDEVLWRHIEQRADDFPASAANTQLNEYEEILKMQSDLGNIRAQLTLSDQYLQGNPALNIQQNIPQAMEHLERAAQLGNPQAQFNVGHLLSRGGDRQNVTLSKEYFEKAIEGGELLGYTGLAYLYYYGEGVEKNMTKAVELFEKASEFGNVMSKVNLAIILWEGTPQIPSNKSKSNDLLYSIVKQSVYAQMILGERLIVGLPLNITCPELLEHLTSDKSIMKASTYLKNAEIKAKLRQYDTALLYALYAAFIGDTSAFKKVNELLDQGTTFLSENNGTDPHIVKIVNLFQDGMLRDRASLVEVAHLLTKRSTQFSPNPEKAMLIYNATADTHPQSLFYLSYLSAIYNADHPSLFNITLAKELNSELISKSLNGLFKKENIVPALLWKLALIVIQVFHEIKSLFV